MPVILVHGNPETAAVWDQLAERLAEAGREDQVRLSPPGFGAPVPAGFEATVQGYQDWLVAELESLPQPVDLVGHDWGGGHTVNVAMARPDLLRSWCSDAVGLFDPDYVWHELAQVWQTADDGEAWIAGQLAAGVAARAARMTARGMDETTAIRLAEGFDARMGECILRLYRSARQPAMAERGADLERAAARPGLALVATADHVVGSEEQRHRCAARAGASTAALDGLGHWWMTEDGGRTGAAALQRFWSSL